MDFQNERYVRLYVKETTLHKLLCFEAQALLPQILKIVDRAGVLDLSGIEAWEAVASHLPKWPPEFVRTGLQDLLARRVLELGDDVLVWPKYIEAQEAKSSDKFRQQESRIRRRMAARREGEVVTKPLSHGTNRDSDSGNSGHAVTHRDKTSLPVTASHSSRASRASRASKSSRATPSDKAAAAAVPCADDARVVLALINELGSVFGSKWEPWPERRDHLRAAGRACELYGVSRVLEHVRARAWDAVQSETNAERSSRFWNAKSMFAKKSWDVGEGIVRAWRTRGAPDPKGAEVKTNGSRVGWVVDDITGEPRWQDQWGRTWLPDQAPEDAPPPPGAAN